MLDQSINIVCDIQSSCARCAPPGRMQCASRRRRENESSCWPRGPLPRAHACPRRARTIRHVAARCRGRGPTSQHILYAQRDMALRRRRARTLRTNYNNPSRERLATYYAAYTCIHAAGSCTSAGGASRHHAAHVSRWTERSVARSTLI